MTKNEALKLALSTLDEVRQETFRLSRDGQKLYAEDKVWSTIISIKEVLAQPEHDNIYGYASSLATAIWHKHYIKESPKFALLDTTEGVLTQIDNMTCGLVREKPAQPEQTNTRPYYTIDELNAWADEKEKQAWRNAAIRIGEELSSVGPDGYYDMNAWQWLDWAMENVKKAQPERDYERGFVDGMQHQMQSSVDKAVNAMSRPWVGLTKEEIAEFDTWHDHREEEIGWCNPSEIVAYIEAKLKQKNGYAEEKNT